MKSPENDDVTAHGVLPLNRWILPQAARCGWSARSSVLTGAGSSLSSLAMLVETAMSLAAPWPLKVILDNVVGTHKVPEWLAPFRSSLLGDNKMALAAVAGIATVLIAALGAVASYIDNYYTESVGQWVAHDLRMRVYDHLQHLSLGYYDSHQTGALLSTITDDIKTIQDFASSSTLDILVDLLTIVGMFGVMLWLEFDFALIAVARDRRFCCCSSPGSTAWSSAPPTRSGTTRAISSR